MSNYDIKPTVLAFDEKTGMYTQVERVITNQEQADQFYLELSNKISPENIHEDGEITLHEADSKYLAILKTILKLKMLLKNQILKWLLLISPLLVVIYYQKLL